MYGQKGVITMFDKVVDACKAIIVIIITVIVIIAILSASQGII